MMLSVAKLQIDCVLPAPMQRNSILNLYTAFFLYFQGVILKSKLVLLKKEREREIL